MNLWKLSRELSDPSSTIIWGFANVKNVFFKVFKSCFLIAKKKRIVGLK